MASERRENSFSGGEDVIYIGFWQFLSNQDIESTTLELGQNIVQIYKYQVQVSKCQNINLDIYSKTLKDQHLVNLMPGGHQGPGCEDQKPRRNKSDTARHPSVLAGKLQSVISCPDTSRKCLQISDFIKIGQTSQLRFTFVLFCETCQIIIIDFQQYQILKRRHWIRNLIQDTQSS